MSLPSLQGNIIFSESRKLGVIAVEHEFYLQYVRNDYCLRSCCQFPFLFMLLLLQESQGGPPKERQTLTQALRVLDIIAERNLRIKVRHRLNLLEERSKPFERHGGAQALERNMLATSQLGIFIHVRSKVQGHHLRGCFQFSFVLVTHHVNHYWDGGHLLIC